MNDNTSYWMMKKKKKGNTLRKIGQTNVLFNKTMMARMKTEGGNRSVVLYGEIILLPQSSTNETPKRK